MSDKPQMVYVTGDDPRVVKSVPDLVRYMVQELGISPPVGKDRKPAYAAISKEMEAQGWVIGDLVKAVRYCKARRIQIRKPWGLLYYVHDAKGWVERADVYDLQAKVAEAMSRETDETWLRRLATARGKALQQVYLNWEAERNV